MELIFNIKIDKNDKNWKKKEISLYIVIIISKILIKY